MKYNYKGIGVRLPFVLVLVILCAVLAGCGNKDGSPDISSVSSESVSRESVGSQNDSEIPGLTIPQIFETLPDTGLELPDDEWEY
ncbi:MAG: hypothetical protein J6L96_02355 [Clostridia bacterium]|nr:hypothetical protein [Clostridia bacterium]